MFGLCPTRQLMLLGCRSKFSSQDGKRGCAEGNKKKKADTK